MKLSFVSGRYYLKLGHFHEVLDRKFTSLPEVRKWFIEGDRELSDKTAKFIHSMFRGSILTSVLYNTTRFYPGPN